MSGSVGDLKKVDEEQVAERGREIVRVLREADILDDPETAPALIACAIACFAHHGFIQRASEWARTLERRYDEATAMAQRPLGRKAS